IPQPSYGPPRPSASVTPNAKQAVSATAMAAGRAAPRAAATPVGAAAPVGVRTAAASLVRDAVTPRAAKRHAAATPPLRLPCSARWLPVKSQHTPQPPCR